MKCDMEQLPFFLVVFLCSLLSVPSLCVGKPQHMIIGGHEAKPHSRPYMAYLHIDGFTCGGSLIAPNWILSAAHCYGNVIAILGAHDVSAEENTQQIIGVEKYFVHPDYNDDTVDNDIMLLKLSSRAQINRYVKPISLTFSYSDLPKDLSCEVAGWGRIENLNTTAKLFETNVTTVSRRICRRYYSWLTEGMVCAGSSTKMADASKGDSGGPLICYGVQEGIVSFGYDHPPGVYSRVGHYLNWIRQIMSEHGDQDN